MTKKIDILFKVVTIIRLIRKSKSKETDSSIFV
jgi:hypothetical protein